MAVETKTNEELMTVLKEWILSEPEVPETSDDLLRLFVHLAKGEEDVAKGRLLSYYNIRKSTPELFCDRDLNNEQMKNTLDLYYMFVSPKPTPDGFRVVIHRAVMVDFKKYDMLGQMKYLVMNLDASILDEDICPGYIIIMDIDKLSTGHILKISPSGVQKTSSYFEEGIPTKIQEVFLINAPPVVDIMLRTIKPFINRGFISKLNIVKAGDMDKLYERVPKECLPSEYGGLLSASAALNEINTQKLRSLQSRFESEEAVLKTLKTGH